MALEKSTYVATQSNGRLEFKSSGDGLQIDVVSADGNTADTAAISALTLWQAALGDFGGA